MPGITQGITQGIIQGIDPGAIGKEQETSVGGPPGNGSSDFAFSTAMFPSAVDGQARTMAEINAASGYMALLADASGADTGGGNGSGIVCIYHSIPSQVLDGHVYNPALLTAMEAMHFYGARQLRMVTDRQLEEAGTETLAGCGALVIPAVGYASDGVVSAVRKWALSRPLAPSRTRKCTVTTPLESRSAPQAEGEGCSTDSISTAGTIPLLVLQANSSSKLSTISRAEGGNSGILADVPVASLAFAKDEHGRSRNVSELQFLLGSFHAEPGEPRSMFRDWMEPALLTC